MIDPTDDEAKKLTEAIGKLTKAADDLGSLPDAITKAVASAATGAPPTGPTKPSKPESVTGWASGKPTADSSEGYKRAWEVLHPKPTAENRPSTPTSPPPLPAPSESQASGTRSKGPPKSRMAKLWRAFRPAVTKQFNKTAAGRLAGRVSAGGKSGGKIGNVVGKAMGGASGAATGAGIGAAAGKAIPIVGAVVAVAGALNDFRKHVQEAADSALEAHRKYAEVSGSQAAIFAENDMKQILRDSKQGEETAGSTKELSDAVNDRKDQFAPLNTAIDNLTNTVLANMQSIMNNFMEPLVGFATDVVKTANDIYDCLPWAHARDPKKIEEFGTLNDIRDRVFEDAKQAGLKARAAMDKARDAAKGIRPGRGGDF